MPSAADRQRAYLVCRPIFAGHNAQLRKTKKIRELIDKHRSSLGPLVTDLGPTSTVEVVKDLLERGIFQSEVKAKLEFPNLFLSSSARDAQRTASENDAARSAAEALEEVASLDEPPYDPEREYIREEVVEEEEAEVPAIDDVPLPSMPCLYPAYIPYKTQHIILSSAQRVLEECCFEFAQKWLPTVLESNGWDCPMAGELTKWTRLLTRRSEKMPASAFKVHGENLRKALISVNQLRHTAVHRIPMTARGVCSLIQSSMEFTEVLQDTARMAQLEELHDELDSKIKAMELNKNVLEANLSNELQEIKRQREELDRKEKELVATGIREDQENKSLIGLLLEDAIKKILDETTSQEEVDKNHGNNEVTGTDVNGYAETDSGDL